MKLKWISMALASCMMGLGQSAYAGDVAIGLKASTLGASGELVANIVPALVNGRLQVNGFSYDQTFTDTSVTYDGTLKLFSAAALADIYPFAGKFRITGGLYYNGNNFTITGVPTVAQTFTFNGNTYTSAQLGSVTGKVDFNSVAPYLGIGWGDSVSDGSPFGFSFEIGALYQGTPKTSLTTSLTPVLAAQLATDIAAEKKKLDDALKSYKFYPVISLGINYKF